MVNALILLSIMAVILLFVAYRQGRLAEGLKETKSMFINVLPLLIFAFIIVGFIDLLLPEETLQNWLGENAGWKGLVIGPAIGALIQGGPFAFFPLFDTVFRDNVTVGTAVAMITAWGMINIGHLPFELSFLGPRFVLLKYCLYITLPSLAGLTAFLLFG